MSGYLSSGLEKDCVACGACNQVCKKDAISMIENEYGFWYPVINTEKCVHCDQCLKVCPLENKINKNPTYKLSYGGYIKDDEVRKKSTSGGAFTAICKEFCDENYVIFGAASKGIKVAHTYVEELDKMEIFYSSKYAQSQMGNSFNEIKEFLKKGKKVLFSGTPCQVAGLYSFLKGENTEKLLTVEVLCTGIPSALFVRKYEEWCINRYKSPVKFLNYRYTNTNRWDDQTTYVELEDGRRIVTERWFSNFYSIFLQRLMSRPSCNACRFVSRERVADITLSDLWGVDKECPDLYGNGAGSSWVICNSNNGLEVFQRASEKMIGHAVDFEAMRKYQRPGMIEKNVHPQYSEFMDDLKKMSYTKLCKKWAKKPSIKLLFQKKIWNNRNRVRAWKFKQITYNFLKK